MTKQANWKSRFCLSVTYRCTRFMHRAGKALRSDSFFVSSSATSESVILTLTEEVMEFRLIKSHYRY